MTAGEAMLGCATWTPLQRTRLERVRAVPYACHSCVSANPYQRNPPELRL